VKKSKLNLGSIWYVIF